MEYEVQTEEAIAHGPYFNKQEGKWTIEVDVIVSVQIAGKMYKGSETLVLELVEE